MNNMLIDLGLKMRDARDLVNKIKVKCVICGVVFEHFSRNKVSHKKCCDDCAKQIVKQRQRELYLQRKVKKGKTTP